MNSMESGPVLPGFESQLCHFELCELGQVAKLPGASVPDSSSVKRGTTTLLTLFRVVRFKHVNEKCLEQCRRVSTGVAVSVSSTGTDRRQTLCTAGTS